MAQVVPGPSNNSSVIYQLHPSKTLPTVDLSITIVRHFVNDTAFLYLQRVIIELRLNKLQHIIPLSFLITIISYVVPVEIGRVIAPIVWVVGILGVFGMFLQLRYEMVYLLLQTYDSILLLILGFTTYATLMLMLNDTRVFVVLHWLTMWPASVLGDANIIFVRRGAIANCTFIVITLYLSLACKR